MNCKNCVKYDRCTDVHKSTEEKQGENWADYCDYFDSGMPPLKVKSNGIVAVQSNVNAHISFYDEKTLKFIGHMQCRKFINKSELIECIKAFLKITENER